MLKYPPLTNYIQHIFNLIGLNLVKMLKHPPLTNSIQHIFNLTGINLVKMLKYPPLTNSIQHILSLFFLIKKNTLFAPSMVVLKPCCTIYLFYMFYTKKKFIKKIILFFVMHVCYPSTSSLLTYQHNEETISSISSNNM
jgi:hypothetical protein